MQPLKHLAVILGLTLSALAEESSKYPRSISLSYEIIGSAGTQQPLAEILYNPETTASHLASWTPPSLDHLKSTTPEATSAPLVRISLPDGTSSVASLTAFDPNLSQHINLWLSTPPNTNGAKSDTSSPSIFAASITSISPPPLNDEEVRQRRKEERARAKGKPIPSPKPKPKQPKKNKKSGKDLAAEPGPGGPVVQVNILRSSPGIKPQLLSRAPPQVDSEGREIPQEEQQEKTFFQKYWWVIMAGSILLMSGGGGGGEK